MDGLLLEPNVPLVDLTSSIFPSREADRCCSENTLCNLFLRPSCKFQPPKCAAQSKLLFVLNIDDALMFCKGDRRLCGDVRKPYPGR
jgi:hypothetical protein